MQSSRHSKLEKADILEMTVKHLRNLQRMQMSGKFTYSCTCVSGCLIKPHFKQRQPQTRH